MKFKILILITLIAIGCVGYYAFAASKKSGELQTPISEKSVKPTKNPDKLSIKMKEFIDPSGFKFSYPADLKIETLDKKDPAYYSSLKLYLPGSINNLTIDVTSTKYKSLVEWVANNKEISGNSKNIKLAGLEAKEINSNNKKITVAVDIETLITVTSSYTKENEADWNKVNDIVVSTFAFEQPEEPVMNDETESTEEDVVFEGEEVIE